MSATLPKPTSAAGPQRPWTPLLMRTRAWWDQRAPRERQLVTAAAVVLAAMLAWWLLIVPVWRTARDVPAQIQLAEYDLRWMQRDAALAKPLLATPALPQAAAHAALQAATQQLAGTATLQLADDRATLSVNGTAPDALRNWIAQARTGARAQVQSVQLTSTGSQSWSGQVVVRLAAGGA